MIAFLKGTIKEVEMSSLILEVGGVGYEVRCMERECLRFAAQEGKELELYTYYHLRENAAELYGFLRKEERHMFVILIGISGIGPKGALNILNSAPLDVLQRAIAEGETSILTKVSGIGNRIAQKIILELKDKFAGDWAKLPGNIKTETDVLEALQSLGYSRSDIQRALRDIPDGIERMEDKIREALKILGGHK